MISEYQLKANELNENFFESIKNLYAGKEISIVIRDLTNPLPDRDETMYLLESEKNKRLLFEALSDAIENKNLVSFSAEEIVLLKNKIPHA